NSPDSSASTVWQPRAMPRPGMPRPGMPSPGMPRLGMPRTKDPAARTATRPAAPARLPPAPKRSAVRAFNFSPGPAMLPLEVLEQARAELIDWQGVGASVMEISHRSKAFEQAAGEAETDLRELLSIPRNYKVLFLQGGASAQFAFVPMNLAAPESTVDYVNTGHWSHKAITEAGRYCKLHVAGNAGGDYIRVPPQSELRFGAGAAYAHYTPNETIGGVEFGYVPETRGVPLV